MNSQSDTEELIERILANDESAFEELVRATHRLVRKVAAPLVPEDSIEDVVQETYLLVFQKLHHLREPAAFNSWLCRIALSVCYKSQKKNRPTSELKDDMAVGQLSDSGVDFRSALKSLSQKERNTIILREYIGLSYEEISKTINIPIGTVRSRLAKARTRLRKFLSLEL